MATEKLEALMRIADRLPRWGRSRIDWLMRIGIDDDTTIEQLNKINDWLDEMNEDRKHTLFSVIDLKPTGGFEFLEELVKEIYDGLWKVHPEIKNADQLTYFLELEEYPAPDMTRTELLKYVADPKHGEKELASQKRSGRGGMSHNGWVDCFKPTR